MSVKKYIKILINKRMEGYYYAIRTTLVDFNLLQSTLIMDILSKNHKKEITKKQSFLLEDLT